MISVQQERFKCPVCARWSIGKSCVPCKEGIAVDKTERAKMIKNKSIKRIDLLTYEVTSSTDKEIKYMVYKGKMLGWTCTCRDFQYRSDAASNDYQCKHIIRVRNLIRESAIRQFKKTAKTIKGVSE